MKEGQEGYEKIQYVLSAQQIAKRKFIIDLFKANFQDLSQQKLQIFGTYLCDGERRAIKSFFQAKEEGLTKLKQCLKDEKIKTDTLEAIISKLSPEILQIYMGMMKSSVLPISVKKNQNILRLLNVKDEKKIINIGKIFQFIKSEPKDHQVIYWKFLQPILDQKYQFLGALQKLKHFIHKLNLEKILRRVFSANDKNLSQLLIKIQNQKIQAAPTLRYLESLNQYEKSTHVLIIRFKIILQILHKGKLVSQSWRPSNFDELQSFKKQQYSCLDLRKAFKYSFGQLPNQLEIITVDKNHYQVVPVSGKDNNCLINALFGAWNQKFWSLQAQNHVGFRSKIILVLKEYAKKIREADNQLQILTLLQYYDSFSRFNKWAHRLDYQDPQIQKDKVICQILEIIRSDMNENISIDCQVIYFIAKHFGLSILMVSQVGEQIRVFQNLRLQQSKPLMIVRWNGSLDGSSGHFTRLIEMNPVRMEKRIQNLLKDSRMIKGKQELKLFNKNFFQRLANHNNYKDAMSESLIVWYNRSTAIKQKQIDKYMHYLANRCKTQRIQLKDTQKRQIEYIIQQKVGKLLIVRQCGNSETNLSLITKWKTQSYPIQTLRIWLSPQFFTQILYGVKLPDDKNKIRLTFSPFLRAIQKMRVQLKTNHILILENIEVLSEPQRQKLSQFLTDLTQQSLIINNQKIILPDNALICIRVWSATIVSDWSLSSRVQIKCVKTQKKIEPFCKLVKQLGPLRFEEQNGSYWLNLGKYGKGIKIPISIKLLEFMNSQKLSLSQCFKVQGGNQNEIQKLTQKFLLSLNFISTPQSVGILASCAETVLQNKIFLVIQGPTGVGKTYVPEVYAKLTLSQFSNNVCYVPNDKLSNISFHRSKTESDLQGNFVIKSKEIQWNGQTIFKKTVEAGGVIMLSQLNTVVKNNQSSLAWWLRQIQVAEIDEEGDRLIRLQSVPIHKQRQLHKIKIKKGTLIIVDVNTKQYLNRQELPKNFAVESRIQVKPLVQYSSSKKSEQKKNRQIQNIKKYIQMFWDQQNSQSKQNLEKYQLLAKVFFRVACEYNQQKFAKQSKYSGQGKVGEWNFSIRQVLRVVEDLKLIENSLLEINKKIKYRQTLFDHLALRWKKQEDRRYVSNLISEQLAIKDEKIYIDTKLFMKKNLFHFKRAVLWIMDERSRTAFEQIKILEIVPEKNIECYKLSFQVGQWQLLGGQVPLKNQPRVITFQEGVLTGYLERNKNSSQQHILILENIDKMDIGSVSVLNNYLQDLNNGVLSFNGKRYRTPKSCMVLLVAREQVKWSPAQNSRPVYFRQILENEELNKIQQSLKTICIPKQIGTILNVLDIIFAQISKIGKQHNLGQQIKNLVFDKQYIRQLLARINKLLEQKSEKIREVNKQIIAMKQRGNFGQQLQKLKKQLSEQNNILANIRKQIQKIEEQVRVLQQKIVLQLQAQTIKQLQDQIENREKEKKKLQDQKIQVQNGVKLINAQIKVQKSKYQQYAKNENVEKKEQQIKQMILQIENEVRSIIQNTISSINPIPTQVKHLIKFQKEGQKINLIFNGHSYPTQHKKIPNLSDFKFIQLTFELAKLLQCCLLNMKYNKTIYFQGKPGAGKTKFTQFIAQLLKLPISIFQMSSGVQLSDFIGGLKLTYDQKNERRVQVNRQTTLLKMIKQGGVFVLDEGAMSQQAKQVISWFSGICQDKGKMMVSLRDTPGHEQQLYVHNNFYLFITGNDPKKTYGRKQLPKQVKYFVRKINFIDQRLQKDLIQIGKTMAEKILKIQSNQLGEKVGKFHYCLLSYSEDKKYTQWNITKRDMQKVLVIIKSLLKNKQNIQQVDLCRIFYTVYFSGLEQIHQICLKSAPNFKKYFSSLPLFAELIKLVNCHQKPVLIKYEPGQKEQIVNLIISMHTNVQILNSMPTYTQENLIGSLSPDCKGNFHFQRSGIGAFLFQQGRQDDQIQRVVLIIDIHLIKEGVRTRLNQLFQDGYTIIEGKKYIWPLKLKLYFIVPIEKVNTMSDPYTSRHFCLRREKTQGSKKINKIPVQVQSLEIQQVLNGDLYSCGNKITIMNLFDGENQIWTELSKYRKKNPLKLFRLQVTEDIDQLDWIYEVESKDDKFEIHAAGLYDLVEREGEKIVVIKNIEKNMGLIPVIQSLLYLSKGDEVRTMIPGFQKMKVNKTTIVLVTEQKISQTIPEFGQWNQIKYLKIKKSREKKQSFVPIKEEQRKIQNEIHEKKKQAMNNYIRQIKKSANSSIDNNYLFVGEGPGIFGGPLKQESKVQEIPLSKIFSYIEQEQGEAKQVNKNSLKGQQQRIEQIEPKLEANWLKEKKSKQAKQKQQQNYQSLGKNKKKNVNENENGRIEAKKIENDEQLKQKIIREKVQKIRKQNGGISPRKKQKMKIYFRTKNNVFFAKNQLNSLNIRISQKLYDIRSDKMVTLEADLIQNLSFVFDQKQVKQQSPEEQKAQCLPLAMLSDINIGISQNALLRFLSLDFTRCRQINEQALDGILSLFILLQNHCTLTSFSISFQQLLDTSLFVKTGTLKQISKLRSLTTLKIQFKRCRISQGLFKQLNYSFKDLKALRSLSLDFRGSKQMMTGIKQNQAQITDKYISLVCQSLKQLPNLQQLHLRFASTYLTELSVQQISYAIMSLKKLQILYVDLSNCYELSSAFKIVESVKKSKNLHSVLLNFRMCNKLGQRDKQMIQQINEAYIKKFINEPEVIDTYRWKVNYKQLMRLIRLQQIETNNELNKNKKEQQKLITRLKLDQLDNACREMANFYINSVDFASDDLYDAYKKYQFRIKLKTKNNFQLQDKGKNFSIEDFIQLSQMLQVESGNDYLSFLIRLMQKQAICLFHISDLLQNLILKQNTDTGTSSIFSWSEDECVDFLIRLNFNFHLPNDYVWELGNINTIVIELLLSDRAQTIKKLGFYETVVQFIQPICERLDLFLKQRSINSKNHWMRFVNGEKRENIFCKNRGVFKVSRWIQNKSTIYLRSGFAEGEDHLSKQSLQYFNKFKDALTKQEVEKLLAECPSLIYSLKIQCLKILIQKKNSLCLQSIKKEKRLIGKLPSEVQKLLKNLFII